MDPVSLAVYGLLGAVAGILAGLLGVGGGLIIVPVLAWMFHTQGFDPAITMHLALGTSLATIVVTSISSARAHHQRGSVLWKIFSRMSPGIVAGALLGAWIADRVSTLWLQRLFGVFVVLVGVQLLRNKTAAAHKNLPAATSVSCAGGVIGLLSAMTGIGGGSLTTPYLLWHRVLTVQAVGTSSACGLPIAVSGAFGYLWVGWTVPNLPGYATGYLYWPAIIPIIAVSYFMAPVGARLAHQLPVVVLKRIFAALLLVIGMRMLYFP